MRVSPLLAAPALLLVAVIAVGATLIVERRQPRKRAPSPDDVEEDAPLPRAPERRRLIPAAPRAEEAPAPAVHALRLRVAGPHGLRPRHIEVTLSPSGSDGGEADEDSREVDVADDGSYVVGEIDPGRYDLTVTADGLSPGRLEHVASDAGVVEVAMSRAPVLLGTVGGGGRRCRWASVAVTVDDGEEMEDEVRPGDCSFMFDGLMPGVATVTARLLDDREARTTLEIPAAGDPAAVCLEPPCGPPPPVLAVLVGDANGLLAEGGRLSWDVTETDSDGESYGEGSVSELAGVNVLPMRKVGSEAHVAASGGGDGDGDGDEHTAEATVTLRSGINELVLIVP